MRTLCVVAVLLLCACPKKGESGKAGEDKPVNKAKPAEVEFFGSVTPGKTKPAKTVFVAQDKPCRPVPAQITAYGKTELTAEKLFAEYWPAQGTVGHLCAFGLDEAGKVIAVGVYGKNPVTFEGEGEVIFDHVDLELLALDEPVAAPKGL